MSKKNFIALANTLRPLFNAGQISPEVLGELADFCKAQNPAFNRDRWLGYIKGECGPCGGSVKAKATAVAVG